MRRTAGARTPDPLCPLGWNSPALFPLSTARVRRSSGVRNRLNCFVGSGVPGGCVPFLHVALLRPGLRTGPSTENPLIDFLPFSWVDLPGETYRCHVWVGFRPGDGQGPDRAGGRPVSGKSHAHTCPSSENHDTASRGPGWATSSEPSKTWSVSRWNQSRLW